MEKILVLSDSHGNLNNMGTAILESKPDRIIHLGDCWADAIRLHKAYPDIPIDHVPGNCDFSQEVAEKILIIEGMKVLICHGHQYSVKSGYLRLELAAKEKGVDIALFGHTHCVFYDWHNGVRLFNPGSIGAPGYHTPPSYGIIKIDGKANSIESDVKYLIN